ncbi:hypothetical protein HPB50_011459 [Hyalomma asiaticum]|uniref:Uncharacterized protein n=1 Tax=Hyalomma asiaticum TaxID=266040 RepID=A0ACB7SPE2_HYAAI|nr:hypothetical protein HPB50_011459 [Hyalomma asiaticum]
MPSTQEHHESATLPSPKPRGDDPRARHTTTADMLMSMLFVAFKAILRVFPQANDLPEDGADVRPRWGTNADDVTAVATLEAGDAGYYNESGRIYIVQRLKEMIKCMDNQVVPGELEELLFEAHTQDISDVVIVGLPHPEYGQAPAAAIVLKQPLMSDHQMNDIAKKIKATISDNLALHKHLHGGVFFMDTLPKTETGKVNRNALVDECSKRKAL